MPHNKLRATTSIGLVHNHVTTSLFYSVGSLSSRMVSALSRWSTASPINATEFDRLVYHPADELQQNSQ
jgi:hypothetical protein